MLPRQYLKSPRLPLMYQIFIKVCVMSLSRSCKKGIAAATIMIFMSVATTASLIAYFKINVNIPATILAEDDT